jgi:hypothetical protein
VLKGNRPTALMLNLDDESLLSQPDVKLALATELFRCRHLSLDHAARVAELPIVDVMLHRPPDLVKKLAITFIGLGIPVVAGFVGSQAPR